MRVFEYRAEVSQRLSIIFAEWQGYDKYRTQERFSKLLNIERKALMHWLSGDTLPKAEQIYQICKMCNCSADWLLGLSSEREKKS